MQEWDPKRPEAWAKLFGLVAVPMFDPRAKALPRGVHSLMLDGSRGSFLLSTTGPKQLLDGPDPLRWAWSANVTHTVRITEEEQAVVRRWDSPDMVHEWPVPNASEARSLFRSFERSPEAPSAESVIARGVRTFRAIRGAIEKQGGSSLDVVLAFNTVLAWVAQRETDKDIEIEFADAIRSVHTTGMVSFTPEQVSRSLRDYPIGDLARLLRNGDHATSIEYLLDANLLIRHASGPLYQEAHKQLLMPAQPASQGELWSRDMLLVGTERPHSLAPKFVHHTPPSLARALVEVAMHFLDFEGSLDVLDPACGSGVFLIEAMREASIQRDVPPEVVLRGFDQSELAVAMADFCVRNANPEKPGHSVTIHAEDSLAIGDWGKPDIIAMNPPFVAWENLSDADREVVKRVLGPLHRGRPDLAFAFVVRGLKSLKRGGVMAALVPSSLLDGGSAKAIRAYITESGEFQVRLIGHFHDFDYFDATVEPSFIVVSRSDREAPIQIVTAKSGFVDKAIRALRSGKSVTRAGYELYTITKDDLSPTRWSPQTQSSLQFVKAITTNTPQTVADFFEPHLGIRTGKNSVFIVSENDLTRICPTVNERRFFRPIADRIEMGLIQPSGYVFYPYAEDGTLLLSTEQELKSAVPNFYKQRLKPAEASLKNRRSRYRNWWEVIEPVATWLAAHTPRIVSQYFGHAGNFAFDAQGKYAVLQGVGWCWKHGDADEETMLAYLAVVNSTVFDELLASFCPSVRGGQYNLTRQFIERVPLPQLTRDDVRALSKIGRAIAAGRRYNANAQRDFTLRAYGVSPEGDPIDSPLHRQERMERTFRRLAREWEAATAFYSFVSQKVSHPHYRTIINLGTDVIPYLLRDMRDSPGYWSDALVELTGTDPVSDDAEDLDDVAAAWVKWGRAAGYDV
jgi:adenine-specific DNA-methyltransferase